MNHFDATRDQLAAIYSHGAVEQCQSNCPSLDSAWLNLLRGVLRDAYATGFQSGFHLARTTKDIPTPASAIYLPGDAPAPVPPPDTLSTLANANPEFLQ